MRCLLDAEILEHRAAVGGGDAAGHRFEILERDPAPIGVVLDRYVRKRVEHGLGVGHMRGHELVVEQPVANQDGHERGNTECVGSRLHLQEVVGHLRRLRAPRVDDHHRAIRILGDLFHHATGFGEAVAHPGVLADEHGDLGVFDIAACVGVVQAGLDVGLARLLLRQRVGTELHSERRLHAPSVRTTEMVALTASAAHNDYRQLGGVVTPRDHARAIE